MRHIIIIYIQLYVSEIYPVSLMQNLTIYLIITCMKKSLFAFFAFTTLFFTSDVFSQARIGVKGALNLATMKVEDESGIKSILSPQAGLVVYSNLENPLFVQSGLLYNVKGAKGEVFEGEEAKITYSFLEIPLNVGFQIPLGGSVKVSPYVGGYAGYALSGKLKLGGITFDLFDLDFGDLEEEEYDPKRLDFGANVGVGLHFNDRVIISAQYAHGLANLGDSEVKNQTRTFSAGLTFLF